VRGNRSKSGYTLAETMIAVAIMSLVILMVYSSWAAVLDASENSTLAAENVHRERMAMRAIEEALAGAVWYEYQLEETIRLEAEGQFSHLKVISRVPPGFWGERELGGHPLRRIEFVTEGTATGGDQLVMVQHPLPGGTNSLQSHRTVLLPHLENFLVEAQEKKPMAGWLASWHKTNALPSLVRVSLAESGEFPRQKTLPVYASLAKHVPPLPGTKRVVRLKAVQFEEGGVPGAGSEEGARVVFIIDKSASMAGTRLAVAKTGIRTTLNKMAGSGDGKFAIYAFNKSSDRLDSRLLRASGQNVQAADAWLKTQFSLKGRENWGNQGIIESIQKIFSDDVKPTEVHLIADSGFLRDLKSNNPLNVRGALSSYNNNMASFNIHLLESFGKDLDHLLATPTGAEMDKIVGENKGTIFLIKGIY